MNQYTPENMVKVSRYAAYFPTLNEDLQKKIYARIAELLKENGDYCDKGNVKHMGATVTAIAIYGGLQQNGITEEEAYRIVSEEMWKTLNPEPMQKLARKNGFCPL